MRTCSRATARVLLPDPDRPVNQRVQPFCLSNCSRSARVTVPSWKVICSALISLLIRRSGPGGGEGGCCRAVRTGRQGTGNCRRKYVSFRDTHTLPPNASGAFHFAGPRSPGGAADGSQG